MTAIVGLDDLSKALIEAGTNLLVPHSSTDHLLTLLDVQILFSPVSLILQSKSLL